MKPALPLFLAIFAVCRAHPQAAPFQDPANLRGERVKARDGRELPVDRGATGLQQMLRKINTRASILNIVAHPDDEDGGMLTFYSRGVGARVGDFALTRGEGGQNAMTGDFEEALGLLRTQELLANDRYTGVDQMFGTEVDFGFSKTKEEAFAKWTHERCLYDAVRAIRLYRPLIITATFIGGVTDGHGQHQVSGQIAQEAFKAAGDPTVFPDMIAEGILPWQPLKVYAHVPSQSITPRGLYDYATGQYTPARFTNYVTGEVTTTPPSTDTIVHEGDIDPLLTDEHGAPRSYIQFSRIGLGQQKSQIGPGSRTAPAGAHDVPYHLYGTVICGTKVSIRNCRPAHGNSAASAESRQPPGFFEGIDTGLLGIQGLDPEDFSKDTLSSIARTMSAASGQFDAAHPDAVAPLLARAMKDVDLLIDEVSKARRGTAQARQSALHELRVKKVQINDALALAIGLQMTVTAQNADLPIRQTASADVRISAASAQPVVYQTLTSENSAGKGQTAGMRNDQDARLMQNRPFTASCSLESSLVATPTRPYFSRKNIEVPVYALEQAALRNSPSTPHAFACFANFSFEGVIFRVGAVAQHDGQPVQFVPPASLTLSSHAQVFPQSMHAVLLSTYLFPSPKPVAQPILAISAGWKTEVAPSAASAPGETTFQIEPAEGHRTATNVSASVKVSGDATAITEGYRAVGYGDLPRTNFYTPATARIVPVDLKLPPGRRIAYLPGTGDAVPEALASISLAPILLSVKDLTATRLAAFDTVILGVRTYAAHSDLHGAPTQALLDYVRGGGNVVVQYQSAEFTAADAPYPLTLGRDAEKIIDETAPVRLLEPGHPLLSTPNVITPKDFNGWVNERGHGILQAWDAHYTAVTETHDPGGPETAPQEPQRGALITTPFGKGRWTYCAYALYRQLPEANPGAFRLFINLLASPAPPK